MKYRLSRWSSSAIKSSDAHSFTVFQFFDGSWGVRFISSDLPFIAFNGANTPASYASCSAALRSLVRLRPDISPSIEMLPF